MHSEQPPVPGNYPTVGPSGSEVHALGEAQAVPVALGPSLAPKKVQPGKLWLAGGAGLAIGLVAGVLLAQIDFSRDSAAFSTAVTACEVESVDGIQLGDEGQSISMQTEGTETFGAPYEDVACALSELEVPDSVVSPIDSTRALDGRQDAEWDNYSASWGYHPDSGLDIVVEISEEN